MTMLAVIAGLCFCGTGCVGNIAWSDEPVPTKSRPVQQVADDLEPSGNAANGESRPGIIGSLRDLIQSNNVFEEAGVGEGLLQQLDDAATQLGEIQRQNREAIRQVNRQQRLGRNAQSPNIVLIQLDRPLYSGATEEVSTPHIDQLVEEGLTFTQHYAASSDLRLARWSFLTGRNPALVQPTNGGATNGQVSLPENRGLLSGLLWNGGYITAFIGQWDDTDLPVQRGFDEWVGFRNRSEAAPFPASISIDATTMKLVQNASKKEGVHAIDLFASEAVNFLQRNQQTRRPFFLHVSLPTFSKEGKPVPQIDRAVGTLVNALQQLRLNTTTCVILTSETGPEYRQNSGHQGKPEALPNGTQLFSHGLGEGNLRIPLVFYWPGQIRSGTTNHLSAAWDLVPTLIELTSTQRRPARTDGISFVSTLRSRPQQQVPALLYWATSDRKVQAVRKGNWKGIYVQGESAVRLFDLTSDTAETTNVAKEHPDVIEQLIVK
ncbi:MAG TPA: sulfatase-like hydrolase/transferase [Planctomicrobium sp.]|nr:sulfatase-like hydrolase/transferase [Planctomicrobium sp.]